jgi:hydroxypyruvate isomerase
MPAYAPNISWLFPELPFEQRPQAVASLGFDALEFGFLHHAEVPKLKTSCEALGLKMVLFNLDVPVWDEANRGYLVDPLRRDEFKRKLDEALEAVEQLNVQKVMLPVGVELPEMRREAQRECMVENLRYAAPLAEQAGTVFTIEMLNPFDNSGYFLTSTHDGLSVVREVDHSHIKFQFDTYHVQLLEGNLTQTLVNNIDAIGHIQFADAPGRHEPGTGEINFANIAAAAEEAGYEGHIGLEYIPLAQGSAALAWCKQEGAPSN